jgi:hypothetical protein
LKDYTAEIKTIKNLKQNLLMWTAISILFSSIFVGLLTYFIILTINEIIADGQPLMMIRGNMNNLGLCLIVGILAAYFAHLKNVTEKFITKKSNELNE